MKYDTFDKYPRDGTTAAERALLTAWGCLPGYRDDLVLVGGLAVRCLTRPPRPGQPGPVTLDVDFGISLGASGGMYAGIREILSGQGFAFANGRFARNHGRHTLYIDLLTDQAGNDGGTVMVDDGVPVTVANGIDRALACRRLVRIEGHDLLDVAQAASVAVAEVGPMLVLKLNAFGGKRGRRAPKDAHDILYLALNYLDGPIPAIAAFRAEKEAGNSGYDQARHCLQEYFADENALGPVACAAFRLNNGHLDEPNLQESLRIRQQCVTLAQRLIADV